MKTLENLRGLVGENFEEAVDDIIICFDADQEVIVKDSENNGYDKIAYVNSIDSSQYLFKLEDKIIVDVWES